MTTGNSISFSTKVFLLNLSSDNLLGKEHLSICIQMTSRDSSQILRNWGSGTNNKTRVWLYNQRFLIETCHVMSRLQRMHTTLSFFQRWHKSCHIILTCLYHQRVKWFDNLWISYGRQRKDYCISQLKTTPQSTHWSQKCEVISQKSLTSAWQMPWSLRKHNSRRYVNAWLEWVKYFGLFLSFSVKTGRNRIMTNCSPWISKL